MCALRVHCVCMHTRHAPRITGAMAYMTPLRRTVAMRPVRASFLLMWAPLPTSTLPLVAGSPCRARPLPPNTNPNPDPNPNSNPNPNANANPNPNLRGFLIPPSELPFSLFVSGAFPSKLLHFACDVLVGVEVPRHSGAARAR